jgi:hypothetical protein
VHGDFRGQPWTKNIAGWIAIEQDLYRYALYDFRKIAGGVIGGQERRC